MLTNDTSSDQEKTTLPARVRALIFDDSYTAHVSIERVAKERIPGIQFFHNPQPDSDDIALKNRFLSITMRPVREGFAPETREKLKAENQTRKKVLSDALLDTWPHLIFVDINGGDSGSSDDGLVVLEALKTAKKESAHFSWWGKWPKVVIVSHHTNQDIHPSKEDHRITNAFETAWFESAWAPICKIGKRDLYGEEYVKTDKDVISYRTLADHSETVRTINQWDTIWASLRDVYTPDEGLLPKVIRVDFVAADRAPERSLDTMRGLSWAHFLYAQKFGNSYVLWFKGHDGKAFWRQLGVQRDNPAEWWKRCTRGLPIVRIRDVELDRVTDSKALIYINLLMIANIKIDGDHLDLSAVRFKVDLIGCQKDIRLSVTAFGDFKTVVAGRIAPAWNLRMLKGPKQSALLGWIGQLDSLEADYRELEDESK